MKRLRFLTFFSLLMHLGYTQAVTCDIGLFNNCFKRIEGTYVDANNLSIGSIARLHTTITNFSSETAPVGHFQVVIDLGTGLIVNPNFNLATAPLSNYFNWAYDATAGSHPQIIGTSIAPLPGNFVGLFYLNLEQLPLLLLLFLSTS